MLGHVLVRRVGQRIQHLRAAHTTVMCDLFLDDQILARQQAQMIPRRHFRQMRNLRDFCDAHRTALIQCLEDDLANGWHLCFLR